MWRIFFAVFLVVACATGAVAGPIEESKSAYVRGDYALAARLLLPLAEQGDAEAQRSLGAMYALGQGVPQDNREAVKWHRKAAEQGYAQAQFNLGWMYENGQGVPQDYQEAVKWYRKVAEQGDADAQYNLGLMYDNGKGVPQDDQEALKWYRKAAEQGDPVAQYNLGQRYAKGEGVPQDFVRAHMWFTVVAAALSGDTAKGMMKFRDNVASRMTAAQIEKAQEMAQHCQDTKFKECD